MSRNNELHTVIKGFTAHPYLLALLACLYFWPFLMGVDQGVTEYALLLETIMVIGVSAIYGMYMYRLRKANLSRIVIFGITVIVALCFAGKLSLHSQAQNVTAWSFAGGWTVIIIAVFVLAIIIMLRDFDVFREHKLQINALTIIALGFFLKLCYVLYTSIYVRQHDSGMFRSNNIGHTGYMEYLLYNGQLPDFDIRGHWQFYHPPLHHAISAGWIYLNENILSVGHDAARESLQVLTLFYSLCIIISAYGIMRYFNLRGPSLYIPLIIVSFHPTFVLLSGSINNDVLSVAFIMGAVVSTLNWYRNQTMAGIIKIALCVGFGMMTKISAAIVAPPIALVFLVVFIRKRRNNWKRLITQFVSFGLICIPLGLWFGIRNYAVWNVPVMYVPSLSNDSDQYVGSISFMSRITDFSVEQLSSPYIQWGKYERGCTEYNPLISLMKSAMFGEGGIVDADNSVTSALAVVLFWTNTAIAGFALVAMVMVCLRKSTVQRTEALFLAVFYAVMMVSFYKMAADYPFTCTMDYRYITPTAILGAVFVGLFLKNEFLQSLNLKRVVTSLLYGAVFLFAACSSSIYMAVEW